MASMEFLHNFLLSGTTRSPCEAPSGRGPSSANPGNAMGVSAAVAGAHGAACSTEQVTRVALPLIPPGPRPRRREPAHPSFTGQSDQTRASCRMWQRCVFPFGNCYLHRDFKSLRRGLEGGRSGRLSLRVQGEVAERPCPATIFFAVTALRIIDLMELILGRRRRVRGKRDRTDRLAGELHIAPLFRAVHVNDALGRPDPVVFLRPGSLAVLPVHDVRQPFHA